MSARGARSRKVQQKQVEKNEKKGLAKGKSPEPISESHDTFAEWHTSPETTNPRTGISRSLTVSSSNTDVSSESRSRRIKPSTAESASVSDISSKGKETMKFQAKGKDTAAPRGRGGGVPTKKTVASSPIPPVFRSESAVPYSLSPNQKTWMNFKVWKGGKDGMRPYGGFEYDEDMQHGSVLIYFKEEQADDDRPMPSIRAELEVLQNAGSTWLDNALLYGQIDDNDVDDWTLSESASSASGRLSPNLPQSTQTRMLSPTSSNGRSPSSFNIDQVHSSIDSRAASRNHYLDCSSSPPSFRQTKKCNATHEIWFTAPSKVKTPQVQRLHFVAIRNFLAMLHGKPIVGSDVYEMLCTLQPEIQVMYDLDSNARSGITARERSVQMITNYLGQHGLDDLRNNIQHALGLLAWAEQDTVRWRQGYLESFVHLSGVMTPELEDRSDFKRLSVVTRRNLGIAGKTLRLRIMEAEDKLSSFDFSDLWEDIPKATNSPVYQSYQNFRQFLISHFTGIYGNWPPSSDKTWLSRKVVHGLQEDFGSLYEYFVDRDVFWNPREERATRKWEMAHRKNDNFSADLQELGMTDMLVRYDAKNGYAHIPHPYPLLPREVPKDVKEKEKKGFFASLKKDKAKDTTKDAKANLQLSIIFSDATNIEKLEANFHGSTLIDKCEQFELTTNLKQMSPREARLGRWVLLYGILQVLSTLSVDVQGLKYTDGVRYFLNTDLKRLPEWVSNGQAEHLEATQQQSWCWQRSWDPMPIPNAPVELEAPLRNERTNRFDNSRSVEAAGHSFPSPPPQHALPPPPPSLDGSTLMQNEIQRLGEKIDNFSLSHKAIPSLNEDYERVIQDGIHDWKPRLQGETFGPRVTRESHRNNTSTNGNAILSPRVDSLSHHHPESALSPPRTQSRMEDSFRLTRPEFDSPGNSFLDRRQPDSVLQHPLNTSVRSHANITSVDTNLGSYPFSSSDMRWPVPPGYTESNANTLFNNQDSTVLGNGQGQREYGTGARMGHPRVHDRSGWD
ncbi:hypothetical protein COCSADRAFT_307714 [Bipolaris sorokiniana ND90Pr]|uniref:DUF8004 domain-containing protein n=1 Tax=Cochliobolus sativus (strain ND90Pr / ATCC 201652) TaxID=665912 RepID=M2RFT0_COCSN|nr:uncharacterized protein COCSADRAFT_307714 [Bipolaris sorokiniana ND90Pr]EMD65609.1 hypothetical protein COCSADRAFT_307714 [Bipolaris sorokiniana ND90Pr]